MPLGVDPGGDQRVHVDHAGVFADFDRQRISPHKGVRAGIQRPLAKRLDLGVEVRGHLTDLRARQRLHSELLGQPLHPPRRHAQQIRRGDHGDQGLLGAAPMRQQPVRKIGTLPQLRDRQLHGAHPGIPVSAAVTIAPIDPLITALTVAGAAHLVSLRGHHRVSERSNHLPEQIRRRGSQVLFQQLHRVHTVRCGHRDDPFFEFP